MIKTSKVFLSIVLLSLLVLCAAPTSAADKEKEFQQISKMRFKEMTERSKTLLEKKYPGEGWEKYKFPKYVYINDSVLVAYKIAVKEPALLAKFPCYCFCEEMGHRNLAYCFLKHGVVGQYDDHASGCNVCDAQAMHAFLWNDLGIPDDRMQKAMKDIYGK
jgi:hypothetical protein